MQPGSKGYKATDDLGAETLRFIFPFNSVLPEEGIVCRIPQRFAGLNMEFFGIRRLVIHA